jgi:fatty-acyl-CoA synthase
MALSWAEFDRQASGLASFLQMAGVDRGMTFSQYMMNCPAYLVSIFAAFKCGVAPVNTNYRYLDEELEHLWTDADVSAVVFSGDYQERCDRLRHRFPGITTWIWVEGSARSQCPDWATPFGVAVSTPPARLSPSGNDLYLLYTGGTTGTPKGVMWRQEDLLFMLEEAAGRSPGECQSPSGYAAALPRPGPTAVLGAPLMHGTAAFYAMSTLNIGGAVVTVPGRRFDPDALLQAVSEHRAAGLCIVGDAFARPLVEVLDKPDQTSPDLSSLRVIFSSGVMFSSEMKTALLRHATRAVIIDSLGSSESGSLARSISSEASAETATFMVSDRTRVLDEEGNDVTWGSGVVGRLVVRGRIPLGYWKDPEKTAATFIEVDGTRYVMAGDWAEVLADGTIKLLGRGSACINTAGEKVFPEEVEEALKTFGGVSDAVVVGVPDALLGEAVAAVVAPAGQLASRTEDLIGHVRTRLAGYKVPRYVFFVPDVGRDANGKAPLARLKALAAVQAAQLRAADGPT